MKDLREDAALLGAFRRGERWALEAVFRMYQPRLTRALASGLNGGTIRLSPSDFEQVAQEAFIRVFAPAARERYDAAQDFYPYLETTARNLALNLLNRTREVPTEKVPDEGRAPVAQVALEGAELSALMKKFLSQRPTVERDLFRLRYEEHLSQEDAATRLGRTRIQIRRLEIRLRAELFDFLNETGYLDEVAPPKRKLG